MSDMFLFVRGIRNLDLKFKLSRLGIPIQVIIMVF